MSTFNVLLYDVGQIKHYNIIPRFVNESKAKYNFNFDKVKTKSDLKEWIIRVARYYFWAKCEYEFLMASWPFGSKNMHDEVKEFFKTPKDLEDYSTRIDFDNIIIRDMHKIDVHDQIIMNIDVITDILYKELKL